MTTEPIGFMVGCNCFKLLGNHHQHHENHHFERNRWEKNFGDRGYTWEKKKYQLLLSIYNFNGGDGVHGGI